ncbi:hypothetical protein CVD28_11620 [Bacillus sp. M6-12]|uniref:hypothetical protein n=1 Tax=Bacillus sp. M6-12 TaxID=2054166 RepID=UPI000C76FEDC|nr:hypothetical protein [Bacillus sp. M6-12]PLS17632.1 hypothetical protein CVD28_11620 [Bacillus sp. M6-12]
MDSLLYKEIITELKLYTLRIINQLNDDEAYTKEMAIKDLLQLVSRLEEEEPHPSLLQLPSN